MPVIYRIHPDGGPGAQVEVYRRIIIDTEPALARFVGWRRNRLFKHAERLGLRVTRTRITGLDDMGYLQRQGIGSGRARLPDRV